MSPKSKPRGRRRGIRCCCLGCALVLLLIAGGATAGWLLWGKPWLARQAALVDGAVPGLSVVIELARGRTPFSVRGLPQSHDQMNLPSAIPQELWLPGSRYGAAYHVGDSNVVAVFELPARDRAASPAAWRREMSARGWHRSTVPDPPDGSALLFEREGARCSVELVPSDHGAVRVWLRYDRL